MSTSAARIEANRANAARSTGPKTEAGKARSRANAFKHGLTGEGVVLPEEDAVEVERLSEAFRDELKAEGEVGHALTRRMAVMSVRMDRCVDHESVAIAARVRQALDDFEPPEGVAPAEADRLRARAGQLATFDPSQEACLARKYEAAAERCFFRALKELRQIRRDSAPPRAADLAAEAQASMARLGSFLPAKVSAPSKPSAVAAQPPAPPLKPLPSPSKALLDDWDLLPAPRPNVSITIGRSR